MDGVDQIRPTHFISGAQTLPVCVCVSVGSLYPVIGDEIRPNVSPASNFIHTLLQWLFSLMITIASQSQRRDCTAHKSVSR